MSRRSSNEPIEIEDGVVIHETELAYKFVSGDDTTWLPKSECTWDPDNRTMTVPEWLAIEKGLV